MATKTKVWTPDQGGVVLPITPTTVGTGAEAISGASLQSAAAGTVTLNGTTGVAISDAGATANSVYVFTMKTLGGTQGAAPTCVVTPGTGFTVKGTASDTSVYNWARIN